MKVNEIDPICIDVEDKTSAEEIKDCVSRNIVSTNEAIDEPDIIKVARDWIGEMEQYIKTRRRDHSYQPKRG